MSEDRGAILARRKRFVIVALAGVGCAGPPPAESAKPPVSNAPRPAGPVEDRDNDDIRNVIDNCPDEPEDRDGIADSDGCPEADSDDDGFQDEVDKCPTAPGRTEGCPRPCLMIVPDAEIQIRDNVYFGPGQSKISKSSFPLLDEIVTLMKGHPELVLHLGGHTHKGEPDKVAQARAEAVRDHLIAKGVAAERIELESFGHDRPLDSKAEKNRRVEFRVDDRD